MTVKELIEKLEKLPQDMEIHVGDSDGHSTYAPKDAVVGVPFHGRYKDKPKMVIIE